MSYPPPDHPANPSPANESHPRPSRYPHDREFATTQWELLHRCTSAEETQAALALARVCELYRPAVLAYVRGRVASGHDAEDLTQGFFAYVFEQDLLRRADPARGRFRAFLLTALWRYLHGIHAREHSLKRGGETTFVPLDETTLAAAGRVSSPEPARRRAEEAHFDRRWAQTLVEHALDQLAVECARQHGADYLPRLLPFLQHGEDDEAAATYARAAADLGLSVPAFRSALHRLRGRYRTLLREAVALTVTGSAAVEPELLHLCAALVAASGA